jgi:hypothetical protein
MTNQPNHGNPDHGAYEHQDMTPRNVLIFLLVLGVATVISLFILKGVFAYLDRREKSSQLPVNPLVRNVPEDTRHVAPGYPATAFPNPRLETDERGQLDPILTNEEDRLYTYGWIDEKAGTMHIPIERAMELVVQRGLPVRPQGADTASGDISPAQHERRTAAGNVSKGKKK